ncbi:MAG: sporulation protein YabP [Faecalibacterium sp.]|nr:sporulation protein YabP [Faecalibacterium sp.]
MVIENRKKAVLTGVKEVDRFDETAVVLETWGGRLTLTGSGLHVSALQLEEGKLLVDGDIDGVQYEQGRARRKGGFLRRAIG